MEPGLKCRQRESPPEVITCHFRSKITGLFRPYTCLYYLILRWHNYLSIGGILPCWLRFVIMFLNQVSHRSELAAQAGVSQCLLEMEGSDYFPSIVVLVQLNQHLLYPSGKPTGLPLGHTKHVLFVQILSQ